MKHKQLLSIFLCIILTVSLIPSFKLGAHAVGPIHEVGSVYDLYYALEGFANDAAGYSSGDTIKLTADINYGNMFWGCGKSVTFDVNGHVLTFSGLISVGNSGQIGSVLSLSDSSTGKNGRLNANAGLSVDGTGSSATVSCVNSTSIYNGVSISNGGVAIIEGDVTSSCGVCAGSGVGGSISIYGNVTITGSSDGITTQRESSEVNITVKGNVTATGTNSIGVSIDGASNTVLIEGNVVADGCGVRINSPYANNSVTVGTNTSGGNVTVNDSSVNSNCYGASLAFGSNSSISIKNNVTVGGIGAYGVYVYSENSNITVGGSVITTGSGSSGGRKTTGIIATIGAAQVNGDVITTTSQNPRDYPEFCVNLQDGVK